MSRPSSWRRRDDDNENIMMALRHDFRRRLLLAYAEREQTAPVELARRFDAELSAVSHHTRALATYGMLDLVAQEQIRGSMKHFYRASDLGRRALDLARQLGMLEPDDSAS